MTISPTDTHSVKEEFECAAIAFAGSVHTAERSFIYASWFDPVEMLNVACDLDLSHASFSDPQNQHIFVYLGACAEFDCQNTVTECVHLALAEGITIIGPEANLADSILQERERFPGDITREIRPRGIVLKGAVQNHIEARQHFRVICDLVGGDGLDELLSSRTNGTRSWKRRRQPRKAITYVG